MSSFEFLNTASNGEGLIPFANRLETFATQMRINAAASLCNSIAKCHPQDAAQIMSAALEDMAAEYPVVSFVHIRSESDFWAEIATPFELEAYFGSILRRLGNTALGINARKRLFCDLWEKFGESDRISFISKVDPIGRFTGRAS